MGIPFILPGGFQLFVATRGAVLSCSPNSISPIFRCASGDGIVSAKTTHNGSGVLAIADSYVVILHDLSRRKDRSYLLKSVDGEARVLQFSRDFETLFFTTSLNNCVQAYSITHSRLLDPVTFNHPSPPTVLTSSTTSELFLSASPRPPTILIQNLHTRNVPLYFQPLASTAAVTCAAFHPSTKISLAIFVLGFANGTVAGYKIPVTKGWVRLRQPIEIGHFVKLHKAAMGGVSAVELVPGYTSRCISVGNDSRCRLIDLEEGGDILRTWRISDPATCLSIFSPSTTDMRHHSTRIKDETRIIIAIGTNGGKVLLFNLLGLLMHEFQVDSSVVGIEWTESPSTLSRRLDGTDSSFLATNCLSNSNWVNDTGDGTIKHYPLDPDLQRPDMKRNPLSPPRDLFSSGPKLDWTEPRLSSIKLEPTKKPNRKSHRRPRIVTETFETPAHLPIKNPVADNILQTPESPFMMSGALTSSTPMSSPEQTFVTPPTSTFGNSPLDSVAFEDGKLNATECIFPSPPLRQFKKIRKDNGGPPQTVEVVDESQEGGGTKLWTIDNERLRREMDEMRTEIEMLKSVVLSMYK